MRPTDRFRRQHGELQKLAAELIALSIRPGVPGRDLQRATARFAGKLKIHAAMETEALYPLLLEHTDPDVRNRAQTLYDYELELCQSEPDPPQACELPETPV